MIEKKADSFGGWLFGEYREPQQVWVLPLTAARF